MSVSVKEASFLCRLAGGTTCLSHPMFDKRRIAQKMSVFRCFGAAALQLSEALALRRGGHLGRKRLAECPVFWTFAHSDRANHGHHPAHAWMLSGT